MVDVCTFLYRHGIQPGKDVILVACNNSGPIIRSIPDTFASIDLRSQEIGRLAAEQLLKRIVNPKLSRKIEFLDPRMVLPEEIINATDRDSIAIEI
jgi:DNA-binding LacI/PurR family transcriptional regulator